MKLVIQIPCYNEESTLPVTLSQLPKEIEGVDEIEIVVIDDGSSDNTFETAKACGVKHIVKHSSNRGLAAAFRSGISKSLDIGADIIVNTDADNQYYADDIEKLIKPILTNQADFVIGTRPVNDIKHFSFIKKLLQKAGSKVMRLISSTQVQDAPSGFRALSRNAAVQLNIFDNYTYTLETIIQAGAKGLRIECIPVRVNPELRKSRLFSNMFIYIQTVQIFCFNFVFFNCFGINSCGKVFIFLDERFRKRSYSVINTGCNSDNYRLSGRNDSGAFRTFVNKQKTP